MPPADEPIDTELVAEENEKIDGGNIVFHCVLHEDHERMARVFDDVSNPHHDNAANFLNKKNNVGKTPLELACVLGRADVIRELVKRGLDVNLANSTGYMPIHFCACWGHRDCLEALVQLGSTVNSRTKHGETPKQLALRYGHKECVDFMDWAAAKLTLTSFISHVRELVTDPEKLQGVKLTKEEKNTAIGSCNEKQEWLENSPEATMEDFMMKKAELEKQVEIILNKTNSPAPPTGSSGKK